jgi:hypothetical protein
VILEKLDVAGSLAIRLLLLVRQEGLHHLNIDALTLAKKDYQRGIKNVFQVYTFE